MWRHTSKLQPLVLPANTSVKLTAGMSKFSHNSIINNSDHIGGVAVREFYNSHPLILSNFLPRVRVVTSMIITIY